MAVERFSAFRWPGPARLTENAAMFRPLRFSLLSCLVAGLACGEETLGVQSPGIRVDPPELDLGANPFGTIGRHRVTVVSVGSASLELEAAVLLGPEDAARPPEDLALSLPEPLPKRLAPSTTYELELQHLPRDAALDEARLLLGSDDPSHPILTIPIRHRAVGSPRIAAVPDVEVAAVEAATPSGVRDFIAAVQFGEVPAGRRRVQTLDLVNLGGGSLPLSISELRLVGDPIGLELVAESAPLLEPVLLAALGTTGLVATARRAVQVELAYTPPAVGSGLSATLEIESSDPTQPILRIPVGGSGPRLDPPLMRVEPASGLDFGAVTLGEGADRAVVVHNDGASPLPLEALAFVSNPGGVFTLLEASMAANIGPGQSRVFNLRFAPTQLGIVQGSLRFEAADVSVSPVELPLRGEGRTEPACSPSPADPTEPSNDACGGATQRGAILLSNNQGQQRSWSGLYFETTADRDWSQFTIEVAAGCFGVGYQVSARVTPGAGEAAEVCVSLGACGSFERETCSAGAASVLLFPAGTFCNAFGNQVPVYVQVRRTGGTSSCAPYSVTLTAQ